MALFNFGKKNEDEKAPACVCSCGGTTAAVAEETAGGCCSEEKGAVRSIKVLGSGCKNCHLLFESAQEAVKATGLSVEVEYITDMQKVMEYGVMSMPALVVNEKVVSMGKVLKSDEVIKLLRKLGGAHNLKKVAFICVHNSCRSQIAEALGKHLRGNEFDFYSAGTETKPQINQDAVRIMKQLYGIDMEQNQYSKTIDQIPTPDMAISMGCDVDCPYIGRAFDDNWGLLDPTGQSDDVFEDVIKQIHELVLALK